ncbi:hypothetical protein [Robiginitalea biformata]|uniref:Uncharacterized protein n=1 Tax=Robiginitalea biformata (strain ATCC BAA-864 / DSM 15991 / KCTC 12146 / HTCC2501) TaxID=313596 RepID=A4CPW6_ROBBH|nr:hypothetical protein [Robiginitalea biformata]EAR14051.1 hypothetical protein RB2501_01455 [Robiginitalea biformata HTCC2501]
MKDQHQTLAELFANIGYAFAEICDDFADATGKPTKTIDEFLNDKT